MPYEIEREELRQLQAIIARHEDHAFKVRSVMYALLTALAVALLGKGNLISGPQFVGLSLFIIALFFIVELVHRAIARLAIDRGKVVEAVLRTQGKVPYDGPMIADSLGKGQIPLVMWKEAFMPWMLIHYSGLLLAITLIGGIRW
ncbi:MAG: hypothetical protein U0835_08300 [Isosphaeraceae bacterium]